jgi:ADP-heptose:LPS heptosyltransferase
MSKSSGEPYLVARYTSLTETPKEYLKRIEPRFFDLLDCIAEKESKWQNIPNHLYDGENGKYTAFGPFQILKSTAARYSGEDRRDPYANIRIALKIFYNEGLTPWLVKEQCE